MSIKATSSLLLAAASINVACVARSIPVDEIVLNSEVKEVSGWFSANGEWALFPNKNFKPYDPYSLNENAKCVSIVNGTGRKRSEFNHLSGRHIVATGYAKEYDKLQDGSSIAEKLLSKKYFGEEIVENFCLRQYIFVAVELKIL